MHAWNEGAHRKLHMGDRSAKTFQTVLTLLFACKLDGL